MGIVELPFRVALKVNLGGCFGTRRCETYTVA